LPLQFSVLTTLLVPLVSSGTTVPDIEPRSAFSLATASDFSSFDQWRGWIQFVIAHQYFAVLNRTHHPLEEQVNGLLVFSRSSLGSHKTVVPSGNFDRSIGANLLRPFNDYRA